MGHVGHPGKGWLAGDGGPVHARPDSVGAYPRLCHAENASRPGNRYRRDLPVRRLPGPAHPDQSTGNHRGRNRCRTLRIPVGDRPNRDGRHQRQSFGIDQRYLLWSVSAARAHGVHGNLQNHPGASITARLGLERVAHGPAHLGHASPGSRLGARAGGLRYTKRRALAGCHPAGERGPTLASGDAGPSGVARVTVGHRRDAGIPEDSPPALLRGAVPGRVCAGYLCSHRLPQTGRQSGGDCAGDVRVAPSGTRLRSTARHCLSRAAGKTGSNRCSAWLKRHPHLAAGRTPAARAALPTGIRS